MEVTPWHCKVVVEEEEKKKEGNIHEEGRRQRISTQSLQFFNSVKRNEEERRVAHTTTKKKSSGLGDSSSTATVAERNKGRERDFSPASVLDDSHRTIKEALTREVVIPTVRGGRAVMGSHRRVLASSGVVPSPRTPAITEITIDTTEMTAAPQTTTTAATTTGGPFRTSAPSSPVTAQRLSHHRHHHHQQQQLHANAYTTAATAAVMGLHRMQRQSVTEMAMHRHHLHAPNASNHFSSRSGPAAAASETCGLYPLPAHILSPATTTAATGRYGSDVDNNDGRENGEGGVGAVEEAGEGGGGVGTGARARSGDSKSESTDVYDDVSVDTAGRSRQSSTKEMKTTESSSSIVPSPTLPCGVYYDDGSGFGTISPHASLPGAPEYARVKNTSLSTTAPTGPLSARFAHHLAFLSQNQSVCPRGVDGTGIRAMSSFSSVGGNDGLAHRGGRPNYPYRRHHHHQHHHQHHPRHQRHRHQQHHLMIPAGASPRHSLHNGAPSLGTHDNSGHMFFKQFHSVARATRTTASAANYQLPRRHPFWVCKREGCSGILTLLGIEKHHILDIEKARERAAWRRTRFPATFVHGSAMSCSVCGDRPRLQSRRSAWQRICKICLQPYAMNGFWAKHGGENSRCVLTPLEERSPVHKSRMRRLAKQPSPHTEATLLDDALFSERTWILRAAEGKKFNCAGRICDAVIRDALREREQEELGGDSGVAVKTPDGCGACDKGGDGGIGTTAKIVDDTTTSLLKKRKRYDPVIHPESVDADAVAAVLYLASPDKRPAVENVDEKTNSVV